MVRNNKVISPEIVAQLEDLHNNQGLSERKTARVLGISHSTVHRYSKPEYMDRFRKRRAAKRVISRLTTVINGVHKTYKVHKRPRPDNCEVCRAFRPLGAGLLSWHHWDDEHLDIGLWLCSDCHVIGNGVDKGIEKGLTKKYLEVKGKVTRGEL